MNEGLSIKVKEAAPSHLLAIEDTQLDHELKGSKSTVENGNLITTQDTSQQLLLMNLIHHKPVFIVSIKLLILYILLIVHCKPIMEHLFAQIQHAFWSNQAPPTKGEMPYLPLQLACKAYRILHLVFPSLHSILASVIITPTLSILPLPSLQEA